MFRAHLRVCRVDVITEYIVYIKCSKSTYASEVCCMYKARRAPACSSSGRATHHILCEGTCCCNRCVSILARLCPYKESEL